MGQALIQIRQLNRYVYDIFPSQGWDNWTRVRKYHWGLSVVGGEWLPKPVLKQLQACITRVPHGSLDAVPFTLEEAIVTPQD